jgi:DNA polymerase III epsilon subunit family exonuclease
VIELSTPLSLVPFVAVDVETTGLDPSSDHIVEIGAVRVENGRLTDEWETLVWIDRTIPLTARQVHGISNDMLVGRPRIGEALTMLREFAGDGPLIEHSHKAFDIAFLENSLGSAWSAPCLNTCTLSRRLFPHMRKHSLEECCKRFRIDNPGHHRALSDARATAGLFLKLLELCSPRYPRLADLAAVASVER